MSRPPVQSSTVLIHTVFSTLRQIPSIAGEVEPILYDRVSKILFDRCYCPALSIGGGPEHLHILFALARNWSVDAVINTVKEESSRHVRRWVPEFAWQEGYAAVTISRSADAIEIDYIRKQKQIHETLSYRDEYRQFLDDHAIEYDDKDIWD